MAIRLILLVSTLVLITAILIDYSTSLNLSLFIQAILFVTIAIYLIYIVKYKIKNKK